MKVIDNKSHNVNTVSKSANHAIAVNKKPEVTTIMFVPSSPDSKLLKKIEDVENNYCSNIPWGVKLMEQSGTPLLLSFTARFPIRSGCPKGTSCKICLNDGVKCAPKGVIYAAICDRCTNKQGNSGGG